MNILKSLKVAVVLVVTATVAACASNPDTVPRAEQSSKDVSGDTYATGSTVQVGEVDRQAASNTSSTANSSSQFGSVPKKSDVVSNSPTRASASAVNSATRSTNAARSINNTDALITLDQLVYFDFDKSALKSATRNLLAQHAAKLMKSNAVVRLEGHADELGTREYNMALGERRAKAVKNYLASLGVARSRMETVSYGEEKPVTLGSSASARAQNRRVEIIYN